MNEVIASDAGRPVHARFRGAVVALLVLAVTGAQGWTPQWEDYPHAICIALRKFYVLPVVLAAIWFDLRAALLKAGAITIPYTHHVILQWGGQRADNVNQAGEVVTIWVTAAIAGVFVGVEKGALRRLAGAYEGVVKALVAALDMREHDTELHSLRVRAYTLRLARELGVEPGPLRVYALAALLHDIGKTGVSYAILLKRGRLTEQEWVCIRAHPALGHRILAPVGLLGEAKGIVYAHLLATRSEREPGLPGLESAGG